MSEQVMRLMMQNTAVESSSVENEDGAKFYRHTFAPKQPAEDMDAVITEIEIDPETLGIASYTIVAESDEAANKLIARINEAMNW